MSRPELTFGTVEYIATAEYCKVGHSERQTDHHITDSVCVCVCVLQDNRLPIPPAYIFLIDVSAASVASGLLPLLSQNILTVLDHLPE